MDYLTSLFEEYLEYDITNVNRSEILSNHESVDDMPEGQNNLVSSLIAGIFYSRRTQVVLNVPKQNWSIFSSLSDQELTSKFRT